MTRKQKLELTWVGKDERPRLEPRILLEDPSLSYHASRRLSEHDRFDNILIQGDNLLALKALEQEFAGKVKCVFIDPPYNTGSAFEHYDDGIEHSLWLSMMRDRLELLRALLAEDGSIWITIDDNEAHYLKVVCDEVFGRSNFVANVVWQKRVSRENRAAIGTAHDHVLVYSPVGAQGFREVRNRLPSTDLGFSNPDNDQRGPWRSVPFSAQGYRPNQMYEITSPAGTKLTPPHGRCWAATEPEYQRLLSESRIYFPNSGSGRPRVKLFRGEEDGLAPMTWWAASEVGDNEDAKKEILALFPNEEPFSTPKPEALICRILSIATNVGDLVLDSFLGSGTTAAVAHKMYRRWIGVEVGEHAVSSCVPRVRAVIDGTERGGVTTATNWHGGGGFRFYRLAPSLMQKDQWNNWIINKSYKPEQLAEAICKLEGFRYEPSQEVFWQHGRSTERDFIYVTTQTLNATQLEWLSEQVGPERSLLILCSAWLGNNRAWPNLTIRKIPNAVLGRCEFGKDDYSLQIAALEPPPDDVAGDADPEPATPRRRSRARRAGDPAQASLLDDEPAE